MLRSVALGTLLGFFSGIVPGPFTALIATTAFRQGLKTGILVAVVPLASETAVMALTAAFLSQLPGEALRVMGLVGGGLVLYLAWKTWHDARDPLEEASKTSSRTRVIQGVFLALLSPAPWVFWLLVGAPLFLAAWHEGWSHAGAFLGSFLVVFVGIYAGIAWAAAHGRKRMPESWHRRVTRGASFALAVAGVVLVWQSWIGNFHRMVQGSQNIEALVDDSLRGR